MREIKFRGKSLVPILHGIPTQENKWFFGSLMHYARATQIWQTDADGTTNYIVYQETVGQFTGTKDENDVEIYEGDIVELTFDGGSTDREIRKVVYDEYYATFVFEDEDRYAIFAGTAVGNNICHIRVIGNVFDNPDLMN